MKNTLENHVLKKIIPFWTRLVDSKNGGFYSYVSAKTLKTSKKEDKTLVQHSRLLWTFSFLENHYQNKKYLPLAKQSYDFLMNHFEDRENGGFYWSSNYQGIVKDPRKVIYGIAFLIYGLSEYYRVTQDQLVIDKAMEQFRLISKYAKTMDGFYHEEFDLYWNQLPCLLLSDGFGETEYSLNTMLHLYEAYVNLYDVSKNIEVKNECLEIQKVFETHFFDYSSYSLYPYLNRQKESASSVVSYGHNIEFSWLIRESFEKLESQNERIESFLVKLVDQVYQQGYHDFYVYNQFHHEFDSQMIWWVQAESLLGFYFQFQITENTEYLLAVKAIWETIETKLVDPRKKGEWFWSRTKADEPEKNRGMAEIWKTPYHNTRALMKLVERIDEE